MYSKMLWALFTVLVPICLSTGAASAGIGPQTGISLSVLLEHQVPLHPIQLRLPPTINESSVKPWTPMPPNWFLGNWFITHSNQGLYHIFRNFMWTLTRPCANEGCYSLPSPHLDTLTSFQLVNDTEKPNATYFAYSQDSVVAQGAYHSVPTGSLATANNTYEILSWGYDSKGIVFIVVYETPAASQTSASLDICSRDPAGPSTDTVDAIKAGIDNLGNRQLVALLKGLTRTPQDGGRDNDPWPSCNATCRTNAYSVPL